VKNENECVKKTALKEIFHRMTISLEVNENVRKFVTPWKVRTSAHELEFSGFLLKKQ